MKKNLAEKLIAVLFVMMFVFSSNSFAQNQPPQGPPPPIPNEDQVVKMVDKISESLNLTQDQKDKFLELHKEHFSEMRSHVKLEDEKMKSKKEEMHSNRMKFENELKSLLNENQKADFDEFVKNNKPTKPEMKNKQNHN